MKEFTWKEKALYLLKILYPNEVHFRESNYGILITEVMGVKYKTDYRDQSVALAAVNGIFDSIIAIYYEEFLKLQSDIENVKEALEVKEEISKRREENEQKRVEK